MDHLSLQFKAHQFKFSQRGFSDTDFTDSNDYLYCILLCMAVNGNFSFDDSFGKFHFILEYSRKFLFCFA